jgi:hypothetical protein
MTSTRVLALAAAALAGCSSSSNPPALWLAPLDGETMVQLIDHAPPVF